MWLQTEKHTHLIRNVIKAKLMCIIGIVNYCILYSTLLNTLKKNELYHTQNIVLYAKPWDNGNYYLS